MRWCLIPLPPPLFLFFDQWVGPTDHGELRCTHQRFSVLRHHWSSGTPRRPLGSLWEGHIWLAGRKGGVRHVQHQGKAGVWDYGWKMRRDVVFFSISRWGIILRIVPFSRLPVAHSRLSFFLLLVKIRLEMYRDVHDSGELTWQRVFRPNNCRDGACVGEGHYTRRTSFYIEPML